ncbi:MAG: ABC transporter ATP-binding protein [Eubacteriales bacterium]|nr:ABC transporter ATP-binding protein [Eubacteriales bacterium]
MRKLIKYLRHYKKESVIGPLFKLLEASFELLIPLVMAGIVDKGIRERDTGYILSMGGLMIGLGVLGLICSLTAQYFAAKAAVGFGTELRKDMFAHISSLSYTELDALGTSTLVTRITSDINQAQAGVNLVLRLFLRSPFIVVGAVLMAFSINAGLALIFVVLVPLLSLIIFGVMRASIPVYRQVQNRLDNVLLATRENLAGARVIRAFSRQKAEMAEFDSQSQLLMKTQLLVGKISALMNPATYAVVNGAILLILWQGGRTVYNGVITQGELIALINYMTQILLALVALANLIITFTKASASAIRINEVFAETSDMAQPLQSAHQAFSGQAGAAPAVEFRGVYFAYRGNEDALSDITFAVKRGQTMGIIGGTGSGKSSVVNLIPRFYDVREGSVLVDGCNVKDYRFEDLRSVIGIVPQNAVLFAGTIRENMRWRKPDASDEEILRALEIAQARDFVEAKPEGLDTRVSQGGKNFSGGQRQRLTIARALVGDPKILIMDDSASALDFATDARLRRAIAKNTEDMTVFIVSQRASAIRNADCILVLDDGEAAGLGTHSELMESCEVYREICQSQTDEKETKRA